MGMEFLSDPGMEFLSDFIKLSLLSPHKYPVTSEKFNADETHMKL